MPTILGIHDGHCASAALLERGRVTWAIQEERMVNIKNEPGMPINAIKEIMKHVDEVDVVALATNFIHEAQWYRDQTFWEKTRKEYLLNKIIWPIRKRLDPYFLKRRETRIKLLRKILDEIGKPYGVTIKVVEHHTAHAAAAFYGSHYDPGEQILVLTADGSGDGLSATASLGAADGSLIRMKGFSSTRNESIGEIYSLTTYYLGLKPWNDEFKVMGLAPYSRVDDEILNGLNSLIDVHKGKFTSSVSADFAYDKLKKLYYRKRFDRICATIQLWFEEMMRGWVIQLIEKYGYPGRLACGGGCYMNVKSNSKLILDPHIEDMFVFPSAGDESISIGAAMKVYADYLLEHGMHPKKHIKPIGPLYLGVDAIQEDIKANLITACNKAGKKPSGDAHLEYWEEKNPASYIAELLEESEIVARCSSRLEFGARALGNRTIMADARTLDIKVPLNANIKKRDFWMPFAPSILHEERARLIYNPKDIKASYMILAFPSKKEGREELKASMHPYDFSIRPQVVEKEWNPDYRKILKAWQKVSGCGGFLNTSFNLHGFPIVKDGLRALWTLERSGLKHLVIDDFVIRKT